MLSPSDTNPLVKLPYKKPQSISAINVDISVKLDQVETFISRAERSVMVMPESMENTFGIEEIANETMKREQYLLAALSIINQIETDFKKQDILVVNLKRISACNDRIQLIRKKQDHKVMDTLPVRDVSKNPPVYTDECPSKWFCILL